MSFQKILHILIHPILLLLISFDTHAQIAAEQIQITQAPQEDTYLAGRTIHIFEGVNGDLVSAAQRITIEGSISEDLIVAGERITIRNKVGDDARIAGRTIQVEADIADDLIAAGETIVVNPETQIGGRVWVAAKTVELLGTIQKGTKIVAQDAVINGQINGDVEFMGENIEFLPNARISGDLYYKSPNEPTISSSAKIEGRLVKREMSDEPESDSSVFAVIGVLFLSLLVTILILRWLFPTLTHNAASRISQSPLRCFGMGTILCLLLPVAAVIMIATVIGIPIGLMVAVIYPVLLFLGFAIATLYLTVSFLTLISREQASKRLWIPVGLAVVLLALSIAQFIPLLGAAILILAIIAGVGGVGLEWRDTRRSAT